MYRRIATKIFICVNIRITELDDDTILSDFDQFRTLRGTQEVENESNLMMQDRDEYQHPRVLRVAEDVYDISLSDRAHLVP